MSRGFLWQALSVEVVADFARLSHGVSVDDVAEAGICLWSAEGRERWWRQRELEEDRALGHLLGPLREVRKVEVLRKRHAEAANLTPAERMAVVRARRAAEGRCSACERYRAPGMSRCDEHLKVQREIDQRYRERLRRANMRIKLPKERDGVIQRFTVHSPEPCLACEERGCPRCSGAGQVVHKVKGYITASVYPRVFTFEGMKDEEIEAAKRLGLKEGDSHPRAGQLAEIFIKVGKAGESTALLDDSAVNFSKAIQRGENFNELCAEHRFKNYLPAGAVTGVRGIKRCSSILDLVCHWIQLKWCGLVEERAVPDDVKEMVAIITAPEPAHPAWDPAHPDPPLVDKDGKIFERDRS